MVCADMIISIFCKQALWGGHSLPPPPPSPLPPLPPSPSRSPSPLPPSPSPTHTGIHYEENSYLSSMGDVLMTEVTRHGVGGAGGVVVGQLVVGNGGEAVGASLLPFGTGEGVLFLLGAEDGGTTPPLTGHSGIRTIQDLVILQAKVVNSSKHVVTDVSDRLASLSVMNTIHFGVIPHPSTGTTPGVSPGAYPCGL